MTQVMKNVSGEAVVNTPIMIASKQGKKPIKSDSENNKKIPQWFWWLVIFAVLFAIGFGLYFWLFRL